MFENPNRFRYSLRRLPVRRAAAHTAIFMLAGLSFGSVMLAPVAEAQASVQQQQLKNYQLEAGPLEPALLAFAGQAGVNLSVSSHRLQGLQTNGLRGQFSVEAGFAVLLENSGLQAVPLGAGNYSLQEKPQDASSGGTLPVVNVSGRTQSDVVASSRQSTILEKEELDTLRQGSDSLATLLSKAVPGMGSSSHTITDFGQTLRGREMLILVDGIPLNTNRGSSRNLANINAADVEQIEVLRGSSAIYGSGAAGGIVAVRTRQGEGETRSTTTITGLSPLSRLDTAGLGGELQHYISGAQQKVDYSLSLGARHIGSSFDAKGNRIAPEPSQGDLFDADAYSLAAKVGYKPDNHQRVQFSASYYDAQQDTDYASDPSVAKLAPGSVPARAIRGLDLAEQNQVRNTLVGLDYEHRNLGGHTLAAQIYYRDFFTRFAPFDGRNIPVRGAQVDQATQNSEVFGGRLTIKSPLGEQNKTRLVWGMDYHDERTSMPIDTFDASLYDQSGGLVFKKTGKLVYMPAVTTRTAGAFAQLQHRFNEKWSLEVGSRYDQAEGSFDDFMPLSQLNVVSPGRVKGGTVDYDSWTHNAGVVFAMSKTQEIYASFSQGFQLPDIGLQVRNASLAFNIRSSDLQAIKIDSSELGWRGSWSNTLATISVFESSSDLGGVQSFNNGLRLTRTSERIHGVEGGIDYFTADDRWHAGSSVTWMKGREKGQTATAYQDMPGSRIPPLKLTAYVEYRPTDAWSHRLQSTTYRGKDYRLNGVVGFSRRDTSGYTTLDLVSQWKISDESQVVFGVENLLNRYYYPMYSQLLRSDSNTSHLPASGAVMKISYTHNW